MGIIDYRVCRKPVTREEFAQFARKGLKKLGGRKGGTVFIRSVENLQAK